MCMLDQVRQYEAYCYQALFVVSLCKGDNAGLMIRTLLYKKAKTRAIMPYVYSF